MDTSDWISAFALLFAIGSFIWTWINDRKIKKYTLNQLRREEDNLKKADIGILSIDKTEDGKYITLINNGKATAKNIKIDWGKSLIRNKTVWIYDDESNPYPILNPLDEYVIKIILIGEREKGKPIIEVTWEDDYSSNNNKQIALDV